MTESLIFMKIKKLSISIILLLIIIIGLVTNDDFNEYFYLAVPLHKGQLSCREIKNGEKFLIDVDKDEKIMIDQIDSPYSKNESMKKIIYNRGV